jgi:hypothetical protein
MSRAAPTHRPVLVSFSLLAISAWWGCAKASGDPMTQATSTSSSASSGSGGGGGAGGAGVDGGGDADAALCVPTPLPTHPVPLDIIFVVEQSTRMHGGNWASVSTALPAFFNDPASTGVNAGIVFFPYSAGDCNVDHYKSLTVPVGALPGNAALLTSAFAADAVGVGAPTYPALQGALLAATAHQEANPTHKGIVVLATDGDPNVCDTKIDDLAALAAGALAYNGIHTYVLGLPGALIADLSKVAAAGGTMSAVNLTISVNQIAPSLAQIRTVGLGCDFEIPPPPGSQKLDPDQVNFAYTPKGMGNPVVLLRSKDLLGCNGQPGWYYDDNSAPTKMVLCPASCTTVHADTGAPTDVLFGCPSQLN